MRFSDVLFQGEAQDRIQLAVDGARVPHAYLFTGPAGVGKEMLAVRLAALLLCSDPQTVTPDADAAGTLTAWKEACGECNDCVLLAAGNHPDYNLIYRHLNKLHPKREVQTRKALDLGVPVIRHFVIDRIGLKPSQGRAKVFVITEAERLNISSQNALLKTLEEPPAHSYIILLAVSADTLLETTRSRCQRIDFSQIPTTFIRDQLVSREGVTEESAAFLSELAQGSLGSAIQYQRYGLHERAGELTRALSKAASDPLGLSKEIQESVKGVAEQITEAIKAQDQPGGDTNIARHAQAMVLAMFSTILRDVQRLSIGLAPVALSEKRLAALARATNSTNVRKAIHSLGAAEEQIPTNANTALIFDSVGIALGRGFGLATA